ncbi:MAG: phosphoesterase [Paenibacillaceae bacterium]|jgi:hypothetical protein|nr:phosphoesterase [Paenibacillaceae bacterium]
MHVKRIHPFYSRRLPIFSRKLLSLLLVFSLLVPALPAQALTLDDLAKDGAALREAVKGDELWEAQYPNGLFNFIGTQYTVAESQPYLEIAVARQGGVQGKATVDFKAIDVSAEYGKDYVIRVYDNSIASQLEQPAGAAPLMSSIGDNSQVNISRGEENQADSGVTANVYGTASGRPGGASSALGDQSVVKSVYGPATNRQSGTPGQGYEELDQEQVRFGGSTGPQSLRELREMALGLASGRPDWKEVDKSRIEQLKADYDRFVYSIPGAETTLEFEDGEYIKYLYIVPLDDSLPESGEQALFALVNPTGGAVRGEFYMSYVNLEDDEEPEAVRFEWEQGEVPAGSGIASAIVRRVGGTHQYSTVTVGTEEGTAVPYGDYVPGLQELLFTPGMTEQTVVVDVIDNPERAEPRAFTLALDRTNERVNTAKAQVQVILPGREAQASIEGAAAGEGEQAKSGRIVKALTAASAAPAGAERISDNGYSPARGQWAVVAKDFLAGSTGGNAYAEGNDLRLRASGGEAYAYAGKVKLYGAASAEFGWSNSGRGRSWSTRNWWPWWGETQHYEENLNTGFRLTAASGQTTDPVQVNGIRGWTVSNPVIPESMWNTAKVGFRTWAAGGNTSEANLGWLRLYLKEYRLLVKNEPLAVQQKTYNIKNGSLVQAEVKQQSLLPGTLAIKSVGSNVGNGIANINAPEYKVFRSDKIEFQLSYASQEMADRFDYAGFELQLAGGDWKKYEGASTLSLDAGFFAQTGMLDAIRSGTIAVRPIFKQKDASFSLEYDKTSGYVAEVNRNDGSKTWTGLHAGDVINLVAYNDSTVRAFNWSASRTEALQFDASRSNDRVQYVQYTIPASSSNWLKLSFTNPDMVVQADPGLYLHRASRPSYKVDGVAFAGMEELAARLESAFAANSDGNAANDENPEIELSFAYEFDPNYPDQSKKNDFGAASRAALTVYASDGSIRDVYMAPSTGGSYTATANNGVFTFKGRLKELGWQGTDFATAIIYGSKNVRGTDQIIATRETAIDFLLNSGNAITVTGPRAGGNGSGVAAGTIYEPVTVAAADPLSGYEFTSYAAPGFITTWKDYSADLDGDGMESSGEFVQVNDRLKAFGTSIREIRNEWPVVKELFYGSQFHYAPQYFNPSKIYYDYERAQINGNPAAAWAKLVQISSSVIDPLKKVTAPLSGATVVVGNQSAVTDEAGEIYLVDPTFQKGKYYLAKVLYKGLEYYTTIVPGTVSEMELDFTKLMKPVELTASYAPAGELAEKINLGNYNDQVPVRNGTTTFRFKVESGGGTAANDAVIRIYNKERTQVVYESSTGYPEDGITFTHSLNLLNEGVKPGYRMTISPLVRGEEEQIIREYIEVDAGFVFSRELDVITALASFDTPLSPAVEFIGKVNNNFDLGMDISLDDSLDWQKDTLTDSKGKEHSIKTLSFGYNYSFDSEDDDEDDPSEEEQEQRLADKVKKKLAEEPNAANKDDAKKKSVANSYNYEFSISLVLTLEPYEDGETYFRSMVLMAAGEAEYGVKYTYVTPIGVPVFASVDISGNAKAVLSVEAMDINRMLSDAEGVTDEARGKYRFDGEGKISLNPNQYDIYAQFEVNPTITIGAGAGVDWAKVFLSGSAEVDLSFTAPITGATSASGSGGLTISAEAGIKLLFIQKKWTIYQSKRIDLFSYGAAARSVMAALNDPYASYLYEPILPAGDEEQLSRAYLEQRSGWLGAGREDGRQVRAAGASSSPETWLQTGVYPYPQTKLLELGDGRLLALFLDDSGARSSYNRAQLFYSLYNGSSWSAPQAVDQDGTWDEAPDAFMVDGRVLVTWSDAGREFNEDDTAADVLSAMNISGRWFDPAVSAFDGDKFSITRDTVLDRFADLAPKVSYDEISGRLLVYFTKADYGTTPRNYDPSPAEDPTVQTGVTADGESSAVYGDIVNGYSVIAYRYADRQTDGSFIWNETYEPQEGMPDSFYGQRFLDLAVQADIVETEVLRERTGLSNEEGAPDQFVPTYTGTEQVVALPQSVSYDPLVTASDVISYNQLALYAYVTDQDGSRTTTADQEMYMQIYNYETGEFHHPIRLSNNNHQDTLPQFVRTKGITYLYWISGGDIVYMDITNLVKYHLKKVDLTMPWGGTKSLYIIDKENTTIDGFIRTAVKGRDDYPLDSFQIRSNGEDGQYLLWTDYTISYKNGLQAGDPGTENPANINREQQIFAAFTEPQAQLMRVHLEDAYVSDSQFEYIYAAGKGPGTYPVSILLREPVEAANGQLQPAGTLIPMNYSIMPDVNGYKGVVQAGDPVMQEQFAESEGYDWSAPVQLTAEAGANYSDLSFAVRDDQSVQALYVKYSQELNASNMFVENTDNRILATRVFTGEGAVRAAEVMLQEAAPLGGETLEFSAVVSNAGLKPMSGLTYEAYLKRNEEETVLVRDLPVGENAPAGPQGDKLLPGGGAFTLRAAAVLPAEVSGLTAGFRVRDGSGALLVTAEKQVPSESKLHIAVLDAYLLDKDTAELSVLIENKGNLTYSGQLDIKADPQGGSLGSLPVELEPVASVRQLVQADIRGLAFGDVKAAADGSVYDQLELTVGDGEHRAVAAISRTASQRLAASMDNVMGFSLSKNRLVVTAGTGERLAAIKELKTPVPDNEADSTKVSWSSSDEEVAAVLSDGTVIGLAPGTAVITASLIPDVNKIRTDSDGSMMRVDESWRIPASLIRQQTATVQVQAADSGDEDDGAAYGDGGIGQGAGVEPGENGAGQVVVVRLAPKTEGGILAIAPDAQVIEDALKQLREKGWSALSFAFPDGTAAAEQYRLNLSVELIKRLLASGVLAVSFEIPDGDARMLLEQEALAALAGAEFDDGEEPVWTLQISPVNPSVYPASLQKRLENMPVYDFSITAGDKPLTELLPGSVPLRLELGGWEQSGSSMNENQLAGALINEDGTVRLLPLSRVADGRLMIRTAHNSVFAALYNPFSFSDVSGWSEPYIDFMASRGIVDGKGAGKFDPGSSITRGEFVKLLAAIAQAETPAVAASGFRDVAADQWYAPYVEWARSQGLVEGTGDGRFAPEAAITRQDMAVLLARYALKQGISLSGTQGERRFNDESEIADYAGEAVHAVRQAGIIDGYPDGTFAPLMEATREQSAKMLAVLIALAIGE